MSRLTQLQSKKGEIELQRRAAHNVFDRIETEVQDMQNELDACKRILDDRPRFCFDEDMVNYPALEDRHYMLKLEHEYMQSIAKKAYDDLQSIEEDLNQLAKMIRHEREGGEREEKQN